MTSTCIQATNIVSNSKTILKNNNDITNDNKCTICLRNNTNKFIAYYKCTKPHNICSSCHSEYVLTNINSPRRGKCPTCSACIIKEYEEPAKLTLSEIIQLEEEKIQVDKIFVHQNYRLQQDTEIMQICNEKSNIALYTLNGRILVYNNMFLGESGFLYNYDKINKTYHLAVDRNKYQFWNINLIATHLNL